MYVVFAKNQFTLLGREYFGRKESRIVGYHDPNRADHFSTEKEAEEFCKLFDYPDRKIEPAQKHLNAFKRCNYVYRELPMLDTGMDIKYDPKVHGAKAVLDWRMAHAKSPERAVSSENYRTWPDLYSCFKHLHSIQSYHSRDYKETYRSVQIRTSRDGDYETFRKELGMVLDFCTLVNDGRKSFAIFDHELSEFGTRHLEFGGEEDCLIRTSSYSKFKGTLRECFEEMKKSYWYEI